MYRCVVYVAVMSRLRRRSVDEARRPACSMRVRAPERVCSSAGSGSACSLDDCSSGINLADLLLLCFRAEH
eukprot:4515951-Pleurochrysis_carterae.AAC.1